MRRHWRAAYAVAFAVTHNVMDAEDVTQDAMVRALEQLEECREPAKFGSWVSQIARRRALNALESRRVRGGDGTANDAEEAAAGNAADPAAGPSREAELRELRERLMTALEKLPPIQRNVVLLHDHDGRTHREIGEMVGCSEGMSQQHLFAARKVLRRELGGMRDE